MFILRGLLRLVSNSFVRPRRLQSCNSPSRRVLDPRSIADNDDSTFWGGLSQAQTSARHMLAIDSEANFPSYLCLREKSNRIKIGPNTIKQCAGLPRFSRSTFRSSWDSFDPFRAGFCHASFGSEVAEFSSRDDTQAIVPEGATQGPKAVMMCGASSRGDSRRTFWWFWDPFGPFSAFFRGSRFTREIASGPFVVEHFSGPWKTCIPERVVFRRLWTMLWGVPYLTVRGIAT